MFDGKALNLLLAGTALVANGAETDQITGGSLRRRLHKPRTVARDLYYGTANIPNPTANPTPSPTISWLWNNDGWTDDVPEVNTDKPTSKPTQKTWGNDGFIDTNKPTQKPTWPKDEFVKGWGDDGFEPIKPELLGPSSKKSSKGSSDTSQISNIGGSSKKSSKRSDAPANVGAADSPTKSSKGKSSSFASVNVSSSKKKSSKAAEVPISSISGSKSGKGGDIIDPIEPPDKWNGDGYKPTNKPTAPQIEERKWNDDGWTPPAIETPAPTKKPTWNGDGHKPTNKPTVSPTVLPEVETDEPTASPIWHGDAWVTDGWNGDTHEPTDTPTRKPTDTPTKNPTKSPTAEPTPPEIETPTPTPAPTTCEESRFHPNKGYTMCTNDNDYPPQWNTPENEDQYLFNTMQECCEAVFGTLVCKSEDICNPTASPTLSPSNKPTTSPVTPSPTICDERMKWHPNPGFTICTNDFNYPPFWALPENEDKYFYESLEECCNGVFGTTTCPYKDDCAPTASPTESPTMAPITKVVTDAPTSAPTSCEERKFYVNKEGTKCSNGYNYPGTGDFYNSIEECCSAFFGTNTCMREDICNPTPSPTVSPTIPPSFGATPTVSKEVTGPPTVANNRESRSIPHSAYVTEKMTQCHEVVGGNPPICVYVCTEISTRSDGNEIAKTTESRCPE